MSAILIQYSLLALVVGVPFMHFRINFPSMYFCDYFQKFKRSSIHKKAHLMTNFKIAFFLKQVYELLIAAFQVQNDVWRKELV